MEALPQALPSQTLLLFKSKHEVNLFNFTEYIVTVLRHAKKYLNP